ncbi:MAG: DUF1801 domain-containing protein [Proteobacteria bacterium]|nr:DUF1801 domain-containing protein [Pseudomonadota bacterium]MDA0994995.1 DUF1801 domain-containing protein [Pseudomonadota bacterium]
MADLKTKESTASVSAFLDSIDDEQKKADCRVIAKIMRQTTGKRAKMWGTAIVGFDKYNYKYESGRAGTFMLTGFSPRAQNIAIYIMPGFSKFGALLKKLGKHKTGKSCLYIKRLADVDESVLSRLIRDSVKVMKSKYDEE